MVSKRPHNPIFIFGNPYKLQGTPNKVFLKIHSAMITLNGAIICKLDIFKSLQNILNRFII